MSSQNSPKLFCPKNRSFDIDAIYSVIDDAKQYVYIAVTDYLPISSTSTKRSVSVYLEPGLQGMAASPGVSPQTLEGAGARRAAWSSLKQNRVPASLGSLAIESRRC